MTALRFVYADPVYARTSHVRPSSYYPEHPESAVWDDPAAHVALMADLEAGFDGWALSASAPSLGALLAGAPAGTRVGSWVKPFAAFKRNVRVAYTWEPVLFHRIAPRRDGDPVGRDHLSAGITLQRGMVGAKPPAFAAWIATLLGWQVGDDLTDLFPGSGAIGRWFNTPRLAL